MKISNIEILPKNLYKITVLAAGYSTEVDGIGIRNTKETQNPDIDFDTSSPMEVKDHLIEKWGENNVCPISNWSTLQLKSLIKDISKFYQVPFQEVNEVTKKMLFEATPLAKKKHGITAGVYTPTFEETLEFSATLQAFLRKYPDIEKHVNRLYGNIRSVSRHAGGVLVSEHLNEHMPLINSKGVIQTPWSEGQNVRHLEPMGFVKFDILGLSTLRCIENAITLILKRKEGIQNPSFTQVREWYKKNLHADILNLDDQKVYQNVFWEGRFPGIFQFSEAGAQSFCTQAKPENIIDLSAITSLYRPGPMSSDAHKLYVEAKNDPESVKYPHDLYKDVTESTFGFIVFQEQLALIAHKLGKDISLSEGNLFRKVLTKRGTGKADKVLSVIEPKFYDGCRENGISELQAREIYQKMEAFAAYGFCKAHAVAYSILSYQCAWLFTYYEPEWLAAFLQMETEKGS